MADHDRHLPRVGQVSYGEAVESWYRVGMAATPRLSSFAVGYFRLSGQYFSGRMATPVKRFGSEFLTQ